MTKQELGKKIETLRKDLGVSISSIRNKGVHPNTPLTIEKSRKGYEIDTLIAYLDAIGLELDVKIK